MSITVRFTGVLNGIAGEDKLEIELIGSETIDDCIKRIVNEMPHLRQMLIDPDLEDPRPNTLIILNGKEVDVLNGLETKVEDGDEIVLISVLHTG